MINGLFLRSACNYLQSKISWLEVDLDLCQILTAVLLMLTLISEVSQLMMGVTGTLEAHVLKQVVVDLQVACLDPELVF